MTEKKPINHEENQAKQERYSEQRAEWRKQYPPAPYEGKES